MLIYFILCSTVPSFSPEAVMQQPCTCDTSHQTGQFSIQHKMFPIQQSQQLFHVQTSTHRSFREGPWKKYYKYQPNVKQQGIGSRCTCPFRNLFWTEKFHIGACRPGPARAMPGQMNASHISKTGFTIVEKKSISDMSIWVHVTVSCEWGCGL